MWAQPSLEAPIPARLRDDLSGRLGSLIFLLGRHPHTGRPRLRRLGALALETGLNLGVRSDPPVTVHAAGAERKFPRHLLADTSMTCPKSLSLWPGCRAAATVCASRRAPFGARGGLPRGRQHQVLVLWELALPLSPESVCVI